MSTEAAVIADSAPVAQPAEVQPSTEPAPKPQTAGDFWKTGKLPRKPSTQDPAPAKKEAAVAESAPPDKKPAVNASESAPDTQKPLSEAANKRFQELANENRSLRERLDAIERDRQATRDTKQAAHPVADEPKAPAPLKQFLEQYFKDNKDKSYEEGVEAWQEAREKFRDAETQKAIANATANERQRIQQEAAAKELQAKMQDAKERYGKEEASKIFPALDRIVQDQQIPNAVKAILDRSPVLVDLMYTLQSDQASFDDFLKVAKSDPIDAIRRLITTESLVTAQLKAKSESKPAATQAPPDKKEASETKTRPPKPPAEVGGRAATSERPDVAAARAGNFAAFDAEQRRKHFAKG